MKIVSVALLFTAANAFSVGPQNSATTSSSRTSDTSLNLFGGKKEGAAGGKEGGPGFMDQMAMFKKAQEMATKKQKLDEELQQENYEGTGADGQVVASLAFIPVKNPMDPNPD